ncbi:hypothetical protein IKG06_00270 [Candidatus Saccharibacteria bacterium]|nr:hypothetical protein [Candidatus Saccharibacteria bacterium]
MLHRRSIATIVIALCAAFLSGVTQVYADDNNATNETPVEETVQKEGSAIEISPLSKRVVLKAGGSYDSSITVRNIGIDAIAIRVYAAPFSFSEDGDTQVFDKDTSYTQISRWITVKKDDGSYDATASFELEPQKDKVIDYKISTPEDVPGGGQYAVLFVEAMLKDNFENKIQIISRAGMTIYATMPGEPNRSVSVGDTNVNSIVADGNIGVQTHIRNDGNIDFQTSVEINAYSIFGKKLYNNTTLVSLLPENSKTIFARWENAPSFGLYRLEYAISALDIYTTGSRIVLAMSPFVMTLAIILLLGTTIGIAYLIRQRSARKRNEGPSIIIG